MSEATERARVILSNINEPGSAEHRLEYFEEDVYPLAVAMRDYIEALEPTDGQRIVVKLEGCHRCQANIFAADKAKRKFEEAVK